MNKVYVAFIASLSVTIALVSNHAFGASTVALGGNSASAHSGVHPTNAQPSHHNRRNTRAFFPGNGGHQSHQMLNPT